MKFYKYDIEQIKKFQKYLDVNFSFAKYNLLRDMCMCEIIQLN